MHYYQFNVGDYASSTQHLDPIEDIAYRRMLDLYYSKESPLPGDIEKIARLIRMRSHQDSIAIVLEEFFSKGKDGYRNKGADKALEKVYKKSKAAKKSASARWNKNKYLDACERNANASKAQCENNADGMLPKTQDPRPNTKDIYAPVSSEMTRSNTYPDEFEWIWSNKPAREGGNPKKQAYSACKARIKDGSTWDDLAKGLARYSKYCQAKGLINTPMVQQMSTFFGTKESFKESWGYNETNQQTNAATGGNAKQRVTDALAQQRAEFYGSSENMGSDGVLLHGQVDEQKRSNAFVDLDNGDWSTQ